MAASVKTSSRMPTTDRLSALRLQLVATEISTRVGKNIRRRREELGLNQRQLADRIVDQNPEKNAAVSNQTVSNWERGVNEPGGYYKSALAAALEVDVSYFVRDEPKSPTPDLSKPANGADALADRLDAIQQQVTDQLAEHAAKVQEMLARQDAILARIEANIAAEKIAIAEAEETRTRLLEAAEVASRIYEDAARRLEAAPGTPAT